MLKKQKRSSTKWRDTAKGNRTFAKRNALKNPQTQPETLVDDYSEDDAALDSLFEQTAEELDNVTEYLYAQNDE